MRNKCYWKARLKGMKIYTKVGDFGQTKLNNELKNKNDLIFEVFGTIDMVQSYLGLLYEETKDNKTLSEDLIKLMDLKYQLSSCLYLTKDFEEDYSLWLESKIDRYDKLLEPLTKFILPIGSRAVAISHITRTHVRKLERNMVMYLNSENIKNVYPNILKYLNRLSDYLFMLARFLGEVK